MFSTIHGYAESVLKKLENLAAVIAGTAVLAIMVLVTSDALLRHVFSAPLTFQYHLTKYYFLVILTMLGLSWGYRTGGAIQIRLLVDVLPHSIAEPMVRIGLLASSAYILVTAWRALLVFDRAWSQNSMVMGVIDWPVAWSWIWVPIGCGLLGIRLFLDATAPRMRRIGAVH